MEGNATQKWGMLQQCAFGSGVEGSGRAERGHTKLVRHELGFPHPGYAEASFLLHDLAATDIPEEPQSAFLLSNSQIGRFAK